MPLIFNPAKPLLVVGLGNPGLRYRHTRHNIGFLALSLLQKAGNFPRFATQRKFHSSVTRGQISGQDVLLVKPRTYMNLSGQAVQALAHYYKIPVENIWVIHDDKDLPFGKVRVRLEGSAGGHNGVQNIIDNLKTDKFKRYKIGIAPLDRPIKDTTKFVLERFEAAESAELKKLLNSVAEKITTDIGTAL